MNTSNSRNLTSTFVGSIEEFQILDPVASAFVCLNNSPRHDEFSLEDLELVLNQPKTPPKAPRLR